jgi:hypothetical protein
MWPRISWIGGIVAAAFAFHGIWTIPACDPYFGVTAPLLWFGIPAAVMLVVYIVALPGIRRFATSRDEPPPSPPGDVPSDPPVERRRSTEVPTTGTVQDELQDRPHERMLWSA